MRPETGNGMAFAGRLTGLQSRRHARRSRHRAVFALKMRIDPVHPEAAIVLTSSTAAGTAAEAALARSQTAWFRFSLPPYPVSFGPLAARLALAWLLLGAGAHAAFPT